jgi:hypothetical protein
MREKVALNEAGWRVGIPLALNVIAANLKCQ